MFKQDINKWNQTTFHYLIYGEGKKIIKSIKFLDEIKDIKNNNISLYYFGDLDYEGISIWSQLKDKYNVEIKPFVFFYEYLIDNYLCDAKGIPTKQELHNKSEKSFLNYFKPVHQNLLKKLLNEYKYIPQEALNYNTMKKISS